MHSHLKCAALAAAGLMVLALPVKADPVADFYKSKRMTMYIGYSSGG